MSYFWPDLDYQKLKETITTVQLWAQIVGKIRLKKTPWLNHSWHVTLYVSPRGLTTGSIPCEHGIFQIDFDFIDHLLTITASNGARQQMELYPRTVADFYRELFEKLSLIEVAAEIYAKPNELETAIPFEEDTLHFEYDKEQMNLYWQALIAINNVFTKFRTKFYGKCSPVHLFWGAFDLAVTRFSGRPAPKYEGAVPNMSLKVMQEAYSHEVSSSGFWAGNDALPYPAFYAYCYPGQDAYKDQPVKPAEAFYHKDFGEFILPYHAVSNSADPEKALLDFLQTTYEAAANTGQWDRKALECDLSGFNM